MRPLELPRMGETMEEGELIAWVKKPGEAVKRGEVVAEIGTDKIVAEMPALEDFVLEEYLVQQGQTVKVGQPIARISTAGTANGEQPPAAAVKQATPAIGTAGPSTLPARQTESPVSAPAPNKLRASPAARRLARQLGLELSGLVGTGPNGRVTTDDVRRKAGDRGRPPSAVSHRQTLEPPASPLPTHPSLPFHPFTRIEAATARATQLSKQEIPHFYVRARADVTGFMRGLEVEKARGQQVSVNDLLVKAVALALKQHPRLNAVIEGEGLRLLENVHIGVMTATAEGLVSSVVRDADTLSPAQIGSRVREVKARAGAGRARAEDIGGATFGISNLGMFGVEEFSAIILPPNVAILAVGAVQDEVTAEDGAIRVAKTLRLTVSADHRAVDGVEVALFLQTLRKLLEQPHPLFA
ncbi:MAG: dihydrolipoamide acetyltransferase family protein [Meiothermus sp.]|nr:dihydrolipoamide acetyltransferase family protein [Meiothermus sp.]